MFVGRNEELSRLEKRYSRDGFEFIPIYGRRRVGKTTLIREFMKGKEGVYYSARTISDKDNLALLGMKLFGYSKPVPVTIDLILEEVFRRASKGRFILAIDEYSRLARSSPGISDAIQNYIDERKDDSNLFLILCGSSLSIMEHEILGTNSPLYGRITGRMEIKPFDYFESRLFLEGFPEEDKVRIYGMVGGIPLYLSKFDSTMSLEDNVIENFLEKDSFFRNEPTMTLIEEFSRPHTYGKILGAIAEGYARMNDICTRTSMISSSLSKYINDLVQLGLVKRIHPVDNNSQKISRYIISDAFIEFYYRHIMSTTDDMDDDERHIIAKRILKNQNNDLGCVFERISTEYLLRTHSGIPGKWWGTDPNTKTVEEIDIILTSLDENGHKHGLFVECIYKNEPIGSETIRTLIYRSGLVKGYDTMDYVICSKHGFKDDIGTYNGVTLVTLNDMISSIGPC